MAIETKFFEENKIRFLHLGLKAWKQDATWSPVTDELIKEALELILNPDTHPVLVECTSGIHQTGTLVGCLRRLLNWNLTSIINEYRAFAGALHTRYMNEQFIELFDIDLVTLPAKLPRWFIVQRQCLVCSWGVGAFFFFFLFLISSLPLPPHSRSLFFRRLMKHATTQIRAELEKNLHSSPRTNPTCGEEVHFSKIVLHHHLPLRAKERHRTAIRERGLSVLVNDCEDGVSTANTTSLSKDALNSASKTSFSSFGCSKYRGFLARVNR